MLMNYFINREWILSTTARRIYRVSSTLTLLLLLTLIVLDLIGHIPDGLFPLVKLLLLLGVAGTAITLVAMEYFLFAFDTSPVFTKVFWFFAMLLPLLGPPLYCFFIYSRAAQLNDQFAKSAHQ